MMAETEGPLFSSPVDTPVRQRRAPGYKQGYLLMLLLAIASTAFFVALHRFVSLFYIAILFILVYVIAGLCILIQGYLLGRSREFTLRTRQDLYAFRQNVSRNMKFSYIALTTFWPICIASLIVSQVENVIILFVGNFLIWPVALLTESRLKNMAVESGDPALVDDYDETIVAWAEPRFKLPPL